MVRGCVGVGEATPTAALSTSHLPACGGRCVRSGQHQANHCTVQAIEGAIKALGLDKPTYLAGMLAVASGCTS